MKVAVLGAGISGLSAAWSLLARKIPVEVTVYEAAGRVGGWMDSVRTSNGAVFELGPRSLRTAGPSASVAMELINSVGLEKAVIPVRRNHKAAHRRLIYTDKHGLIDVPSNLSWIVRTKPPFSKPLLGAIVKDFFTPKGQSDESIHNFIERRFGNEILQYLVDPICRGVYAASTRSLSIQSCFPTIFKAEQTHGSIIRGMVRTRSDPHPTTACSLLKRSAAEKWTMYTLREGLGSLPEALQHYLSERDVQIRLGIPCSRLDLSPGKITVHTGGQSEQFDQVVSTVPPFVLSSLLKDTHPQLAQTLDSISSVTVAVVCLEFEGADILPQGYGEAFGYLVPSSESPRVLGVVFDSATFPEHNRRDRPSTRLTVMMGGEWFGDLFGKPEEISEKAMVQIALEELETQLGITNDPSTVLGRVHKNCIPMYKVGHSLKLDFIANYLSQKNIPLILTGSFFQGVSINDCIHNSVSLTSD